MGARGKADRQNLVRPSYKEAKKKKEKKEESNANKRTIGEAEGEENKRQKGEDGKDQSPEEREDGQGKTCDYSELSGSLKQEAADIEKEENV